MAVVGLALGPAAAHAAGDYDLESTAWNGLSDFVSVASGGGLTMETRASLSWSEIAPSDVLFVLYPTGHLDPVHLAAFVRGGGRLLIADDFGHADEALARLGILRHPHAASPARTYDGNPNLPIAVPLDDSHPLTQGVVEIVTNHPSAFSVEPGVDAVFGYGSREPVVVAGALGSGKFVALSDPSVLINDMLAFDGNLAFAVNLLHFLAPARPGRIFVITGEAALTGVPKEAADAGEPLSFNEALGQVVSFLDELNDYLAPEPVLRAIAVVGGIGVLLVTGIVLPLRRGRDPDGSFARVPAEPANVERLVAEYDDDQPDRNFAFPAAVLRENLEAELETQLGSLPQAERGATLRALELIHRLPPRAAVLTTAAHVSKKTFFQAYEAAQAAAAGHPRTS